MCVCVCVCECVCEYITSFKYYFKVEFLRLYVKFRQLIWRKLQVFIEKVFYFGMPPFWQKTDKLLMKLFA